MLRVIIGLVVPFIAVVVMLPWVNAVTFTWYNIPFVYLWVFAWFILTTLCLGICWFAFDRKRLED